MTKEAEKTAEELIDEGVAALENEDPTPEDETVDTPTEAEEQARALGWRPEEEYEGDAGWVGAQEFIDRKPLYDGLSKQSKRIKRLEKTIDDLAAHNKKVEDAAYAQAKADIKAERIAAMEQGEFEVAENLVEREKELDKSQEQEVDEILPQEFLDWKEENPWYDTDTDLREFADDMGAVIKHRNPELTGADFINEVAKRTKLAFPDKFKQKRIPSGGNPPERGSPTRGGVNKDWEKLTDEEKRIANEFSREIGIDGKPLMTKEQYMKQLDLSGR